jgi:hypothetical protein
MLLCSKSTQTLPLLKYRTRLAPSLVTTTPPLSSYSYDHVLRLVATRYPGAGLLEAFKRLGMFSDLDDSYHRRMAAEEE